MSQTVLEVAKSNTISKIWLCPHYVHKPTLRSSILLRGIECTKSNIPKQLADKEVTKIFKEGGFLCIIWKNDLQTENAIKQQEESLTDIESNT